MGIITIVKNEKYTKFIYATIFIILFLFIPDLKSEVNPRYLNIYLSLVLFTSFVHFSSQKDNNWFRLDVIFLLGYIIVHFQWPIMLVFSHIDLGDLTYIKYGIVDLKYMNYGTWLSTIGIVVWFFGYSYFPSKKKNIVLYIIKYKKLLWLSILLFLMFLLLAGSNFLSGGIYKGQGGSAAGGGISAYIQLLFGISILLLTTIVILNSQNMPNLSLSTWLSKLDKKYLLLAGTYLLLFLSIGDRGSAMQVTFAFLIVFGSIIKPISFKQFSVILIIGAIILTLIGLGRSVDSGDNILQAGANKLEIKSNYDLTLELANSARTLYRAIENVPEHHEYFLGKLWISKFLSIFPFSQSIYLQLSDDKPYELGSAGYITYLRYGEKAPSGEGSSLIADIYLNFGLIGVVFFMLLLGLFFKKLQNELNMQKNYFWILTAGIFAAGVFGFGRGTLFGVLRLVIWGLILAMIFTKRRKIIS